MINIAGIFSERRDVTEISGVLDRVVPDGASKVKTFQFSTPTFGCKNIVHEFMAPATQPFISENGRYVAFAEGELYSTPSGKTSLAYLFEHFRNRGLSSWEQVNGQFVFVVFDKQKRTLNIINDRFGFRPLYYMMTPDAFVFGSQIKSIIAMNGDKLTISPMGLAQFMFFGHHIGDETSFQEIKILPPATIMTFAENGFNQTIYWSPVYTPDNSVSSSTLMNKLCVAVERQVPGGGAKGILLSGGMDSRVVAHEFVKTDPSPVAFTFGIVDSLDVQLAKQVARILGIEHHLLQFQTATWKESIRKVVHLNEGESSFQHSKSIQFHPFIASHCNTLMTGAGGDMIMGGFIDKNALGPFDPDKTADYLYRRYLEHSEEQLTAIFQKDFFVAAQSHIKSKIHDAVNVIKGVTAADVLDVWNHQNRQRRFILMGPATDRYLFNVRSPFYDYDLYDYTLRIPAALRHNENFYQQALWEGMRKLRGTPWQKTGKVPLPGDESFLHRFRLRMLTFLSSRKSGFRLRTLNKDFVDFSSLLREAYSREEIASFLFGQEQAWHPFFNTKVLQMMVDSHMAGKSDHYVLICKLLTLSYCEHLFSIVRPSLQ